MSLNKSAPIGIFDSGIGGLTVVKSVMQTLPSENIIYFGDTARVPYGIKSMDTVREYAIQITDFLLRKKIKLILIACNTVSAAASNEIRERCAEKGITVLDVVQAGTKASLETPARNNKIGVIGTLATINSGTYDNAIHTIDKSKTIFSRACPMLVPLAEEGWTDDEIAESILKKYLDDFTDKDLDALILGCTHYPLFRNKIESLFEGSETRVIDSADAIANMALEMLTSADLLNSGKNGDFECYVSDKPQRFQELAERFLGKKLNRLEIVALK